jgi:undecaprenyl-diphosphatase
MGIFEAIILGIIQGLTEFLPVSSSGHIELGKHFLGVETTDNLLFSIIVHGATALSTIVVFRKDILIIIKDLFAFEWNESTQFSAKILLSMIPVGIVGILFEDKIEGLFGGQITLVASMLLFTGVLLSFTYFTKTTTGEVSFGKSILVGLAQAVAIIPGISRSGSTIATGLLLGIEKEKITRFSFLMVLPPIIGATLLKVKDFIAAPEIASDISTAALGLGFISAFMAGIIACSWMINIVKHGRLIYFAIYCLVLGTTVLIFQ